MTTSINEIEAIITAKLAEVTEEIAEIQSQIDNFEYVSSEADYDAMLDDVYESVNIGYSKYTASQILKNCDPIAYRCGKNDYDASFDIEDCEEYQELLTALSNLEDELSDLEEELEKR